MTSELFWNAFKLHNILFERFLYPDPISFDVNTRSYSVDNWKRPKYIPFIASYCLIAAYQLLTCFSAFLYSFDDVPLNYSFINLWFMGANWNVQFTHLTFISSAGKALLQTYNALLREDINNKRKSNQNINKSKEKQKPDQSIWLYTLSSITNQKGTKIYFIRM